MLTNALVYGFAQNGGKKWGGVQLNQPLTVGLKQYLFAINGAQPFFLYAGNYNLIGFGVGVNQYNYNTWDAGLIDYCFGVGRDLAIRFVGSINFKIGTVDKTFNFDKLLSYGQFTNYVQYNDSPMCGFDVDELFSYAVGQNGYVTISVSGSLTVGVDQCQNIPDGQAAITLLVKRVGDGQVLGVQRNFDFRISDHSFNFFDHWNNNPFGDLGDFIIYGYRVKSAAGFTSGTIQILETWSYAPGMQQAAFSIDRGSIQLSDGKTSGFLKVEQWSRTSIIEGLPKYFDGSVSVACNFADLPVCNDDVYEGSPESDEIYIQNNDFTTTINESIDIHITNGEGLTEELTKIDEPIQPPEPPPELNCDCQVYQAKLMYEGLCYLQRTIDVRMAQLMVAFNANQKQLIQALVDGLKPLVTTEEEARGIADVIAEKELDPIFLVDTNECFYKKTMPPDGDAWIGEFP